MLRSVVSVPLVTLALLLAGTPLTPRSAAEALWGPSPANRPANSAIPALQVQPEKSITEIVETTPRLSVFNRVLEAGGMKDSLRSGGPYTLFLPVNEAFYELPYAERSQLWNISNRDRIRRILNNHIINKKMTSDAIAKLTNVPSRLEDLPVDTTGKLLMVKGAHLIQPDVEASNGIVHVVDKILMPSYME